MTDPARGAVPPRAEPPWEKLAAPEADLSVATAEEIASATDALMQMQRPVEAGDLMLRAIRAGVTPAFPWRLLTALVEADAVGLAREIVADHRFPGKPAPWHEATRARGFEQIGDLARARETVEIALRSYPAAAPLLVARARLAFLMGETGEEAAHFCEVAAAAQPDQASLMRQIARLMRTGEVEAMGFRLCLPPAEVSPRLALSILSGAYEHVERRAAAEGLTLTDRVLELGGGIGLVALSVARTHPEVPIMTVEANPRLVPVLRANLSRNGCRAEIVGGAVAAIEEGETDFHLAEDFFASSVAPVPGGRQVLRLPRANVNRLVAEFRPTVLLMDVEGAETEILPGLSLHGLRRIVVEFHPSLRSPAEISACFARLLQAGFHLDLGAGKGQVAVFVRPAEVPDILQQPR